MSLLTDYRVARSKVPALWIGAAVVVFLLLAGLVRPASFNTDPAQTRSLVIGP